MSTKKIAAIIVAALVAGVVIGSFGIADAASKTGATATPGAIAPAPAGMQNCGDCEQEAGAAGVQGGCPDGAQMQGGCPSEGGAAPAAGAQNGAAGCPDCQ